VRRARPWVHVLAAAIVLAVAAATLAGMGRPWWCKAGDAALWSGEVQSRHNSQHLLDPYTFTHVLHGLALYALVWGLFGRIASRTTRAWIGFVIEVAWELVENTDAVVERYRAATISLDYYGDSVTNSLGDIVAFGVGYWIAGVVPVWTSVVGFLVVDGLLVLWIRDSLLMNVLMLVHPVEAVRQWQQRGGGP
jgi:hypothetical protein